MTHRFVPVGIISSSDDAPGWCSPDNDEQKEEEKKSTSSLLDVNHEEQQGRDVIKTSFVEDEKEGTNSSVDVVGPICWKCRGTGRHHWKYTSEQLEKLRIRAKEGLEVSSTDKNSNDQTYNSSSNTKKKSNNRAKKRFAKIKSGGDIHAKCTVCYGIGRQRARVLAATSETNTSSSTLGEITCPRKHHIQWKQFGPQPYAISCAKFLLEERQEAILKTNDKCNCQDESLLAAVQLLERSISAGKSIFVNPDDKDFKRRCSICCHTNNKEFDETRHDTLSTTTHSILVVPSWIPKPGEQLCHLVGNWRILQRVGSHRWTTDDLMTAVVASRAIERKLLQMKTRRNRFLSSPTSAKGSNNYCPSHDEKTFHYLDLGCGNGSVLSMTCWKLSQILHKEHNDNEGGTHFTCIDAKGIEARKEAVELNRRSLSFNVGDSSNNNNKSFLYHQHNNEEIDHDQQHDKNLLKKTKKKMTNNKYCPINAKVIHGDFRECIQRNNKYNLKHNTFHLITGTPPYFEVKFHVKEETTDHDDKSSLLPSLSGTSTKEKATVTTSAIICQGGMPTSKQSAPARCEFRGGIEVYCQVAALYLKRKNNYGDADKDDEEDDSNDHDDDGGCFVVCENWANHKRVIRSAYDAGLQIISIQPIKGSVQKTIPLFAVYEMTLQNRKSNQQGSIRSSSSSTDNNNNTSSLTKDNKSNDSISKNKGSSSTYGNENDNDNFFYYPTISVRNNIDNTWTIEYGKNVLEYMSIPAMHNSR